MPAKQIETGHADIIHDVSMDYYGKKIATASSDSTIKIIDVNNNTVLANLTGHQGPVWQVTWAHPKFGTILASSSYDGKVILWKENGNQTNQWSKVHVFNEHKISVNSISWAPHDLGLILACGSSDGNVYIHSARSDGGWETIKIDSAHSVGVSSVSWAPALAPGVLVTNGENDFVQKLVTGGCDNMVKIWKLVNGNWVKDSALGLHTDLVRDVAWAPNFGLPKSTIASASQDGSVIIWTLEKEGEKWEGKILKNFETPVWRVSWSLTGNILAVSDGNNDVTLWKEAVDGEWQQVSTVAP